MLLQRLLGGHMRQRKALPPRLVGIGGIIVLQSPFDVHWQGVLPLDTVAVIRVHGPQQAAQAIERLRLAHAGQLVGAANQVMRTLQQIMQPVLTGQQWLELHRVIKQDQWLRLGIHNQVYVFNRFYSNIQNTFARFHARWWASNWAL